MKTAFFFLIGIVLFTACQEESTNHKPIYSNGLDSAGLLADLPLWEPPSNCVYINPENSDDDQEDGSIDHPFDSFTDIDWADNTVYVLKRGAEIESAMIMVDANNVTLASYGQGNRPKIVCTDVTTSGSNKHALISHWEGISGFTIRDIEITAPQASSRLRFLSNCENTSVINCLLHDSYWGLRSIGNRGLYVYNTEIYNTNDDGMFIQLDTDIKIMHCYVHHVNTNWQPPSTPETEAGGDAIQFDKCNNWHVHHNKLDRTSSGNKFCFISNNPEQDNGLFEYNVLSGPIENGSGIYLHDGIEIVICYNLIQSPAGSPIYTHANHITVYGNIFYKPEGPLLASKSALIYNNVFYEMELALQGGEIEIYNNVFVTDADNYLYHGNSLTGSNNLFTTLENNYGFVGNPMFIDSESLDFHTREDSDCIDAGIDMGMQYDLDGKPVPQGSAVDIGVYEF